ncbi:hypothetical protein LZ554_008279 [Drepanopeziza brunnea f. sp. 'monogermtubi']|nr:hypothetical protein LZ554_008279 [Drepanopeziza brunnea f. sp. 'monogermtubi']
MTPTPNDNEKAEDDEYDRWGFKDLHGECKKRKSSREGSKPKLVERLVWDDWEKHQWCPDTETFMPEDDPRGKVEEAWLNDDARFKAQGQAAIDKAWIDYHDRMWRDRKALLKIHHKINRQIAEEKARKASKIEGEDESLFVSDHEEHEKRLADSKESGGGTKQKQASRPFRGQPDKTTATNESESPKLTSPGEWYAEEKSKSQQKHTRKVEVKGGILADRYEKKSIKSTLGNTGYLHILVRNKNKIRSDRLADMEATYTTFSVKKVRADWSGYFLLFESDEGDAWLENCYCLIGTDVEDGSFADRNVYEVKARRRVDAEVCSIGLEPEASSPSTSLVDVAQQPSVTSFIIMAVTPWVPGLTIAVCIDGTALHEYDDDEDVEVKPGLGGEHQASRTTLKYIESTSDKDFVVKVSLGTTFIMDCPAYHFELFIDGKRMYGTVVAQSYYASYFSAGRLIRPLSFDFSGSIQPAPDIPGRVFLRSFRFSRIETTLDEDKLKDVAEDSRFMKEAGEIKILVHRGGEASTGTSQASAIRAHAPAKVHEKSLKGQAKSHTTSLGPAKEPVPMEYSASEKIDGREYPRAIYQFKYRSIAALKSLLIVPRTPSPEPPIILDSPSPTSNGRHTALQSHAGPSIGSSVKRERGIKLEEENAPKKVKFDEILTIDLTEDSDDDGDIVALN